MPELIDLPRGDAYARRLAVAANGGVWHADIGARRIGRFDPTTQGFKEWRAPGAIARPGAIAIDDRGRVWFVDSGGQMNSQGNDVLESGGQPNRLLAFDPRSD